MVSPVDLSQSTGSEDGLNSSCYSDCAPEFTYEVCITAAAAAAAAGEGEEAMKHPAGGAEREGDKYLAGVLDNTEAVAAGERQSGAVQGGLQVGAGGVANGDALQSLHHSSSSSWWGGRDLLDAVGRYAGKW